MNINQIDKYIVLEINPTIAKKTKLINVEENFDTARYQSETESSKPDIKTQSSKPSVMDLGPGISKFAIIQMIQTGSDRYKLKYLKERKKF